VVLGVPDSVEAQLLGVLGEAHGPLERGAGALARVDGGKVNERILHAT